VNAVTTPVTSVIPAGSLLQAKLSPNPANVNAVLEFNVPETGHVFWQIFDAAGRKLMSSDAGMMSKGEHRLDLSYYTSKLTTGTYMLNLQLNNKRAAVKFVRN